MARHGSNTEKIDLEIYNQLGDRWYTAQDDPVALLRAETRLRNPWVLEEIGRTYGEKSCDVLDIGCGGGFVSNALAKAGHRVKAVDVSKESLLVARQHDKTRRVEFGCADAYYLPFRPKSFDVVCAMDFLEHVEDPEKIISEVRRILRPEGIFFFHAFNRNWMSWLIVIKGVEWVVANTPKRLHLYHLFIRPNELVRLCGRYGLRIQEFRGTRPKIFTKAFFDLLRTGSVSDELEFRFSGSRILGYVGLARLER
ncbi:MAG TPA: bifunctional 2-polyprenyl-6-hydroxyphenol methylase/3-demethylubiquinol 3-O-methyltransferase UbiG [Bdellovibrionota bacterium]|nr:bifunctional 2-polyprenyl-6-hydroxyphenol methylase/3-demethylubiquinol 3-O-methyltransferase UbiG [Bdellovibrionota bacterium]